MNKSLILISMCIISFSISSQEKRLFQLVGDKEQESYIAIEAGSFLNLSLISDRMTFNIGYSFLYNRGFNISTELNLFTLTLNDNMNLSCGLGGGILFTPDNKSFESDLLLQLTTKFIFYDLYLKISPMYGMSMFKKYITWEYALFVGVGYQFDLVPNQNTSNNE